ncbi:hypothetical protein AV530_005047 [Patagioenas fasciata monilis]|uniref:Uncharacterized protein n=1 Tax=Patagioenas fasciata monilis TaxID=372326 RepID=A0A1V4K401_PATFA|nr:hypothetical protein AV530_005047 [Patagioenas fasciata monilis]
MSSTGPSDHSPTGAEITYQWLALGLSCDVPQHSIPGTLSPTRDRGCDICGHQEEFPLKFLWLFHYCLGIWKSCCYSKPPDLESIKDETEPGSTGMVLSTQPQQFNPTV